MYSKQSDDDFYEHPGFTPVDITSKNTQLQISVKRITGGSLLIHLLFAIRVIKLCENGR